MFNCECWCNGSLKYCLRLFIKFQLKSFLVIIKRMKTAAVVFVVLCAVDVTIAIPLRQPLPEIAEEEDDIPEKVRTSGGAAAVTKTEQGGRGTGPYLESGDGREEGLESISSVKRRFSESAYWDSFNAPDPYSHPIYLQNWDSQFGRNYRTAVGGHHPSAPGRRLHPVSGIYDNAEALFGGDSLQNWRTLYGDERF